MGAFAQSKMRAYAALMATVHETLRRELERCGKPHAQVSRESGIGQPVLSRFARGDYLRGRTLDELCAYLKLELRPKSRRSKKGKGR